MGWNQVERDPAMPLLGELPIGSWFYFVHSYVAQVRESGDGVFLAHTTHGTRFVSAVARGALFACQFHPEKSARAGLALLEAFVRR